MCETIFNGIQLKCICANSVIFKLFNFVLHYMKEVND